VNEEEIDGPIFQSSSASSANSFKFSAIYYLQVLPIDNQSIGLIAIPHGRMVITLRGYPHYVRRVWSIGSQRMRHHGLPYAH